MAELVGSPIIKALLGTAPSQDAMEECDMLVMIGPHFPYLDYYLKPGQARTGQIDLDASHIGLPTPVEVGLLGDSQTVLLGLLPLLHRKDDRDFLEKAQDRMKSWRELLHERGTQAATPMKPQTVPLTLSPLLAENTIVTCDCGNNTTWTARYIQMQGNMLFSTSGLLATMAAGFPYAIAASIAHPGRPVVALVGDGGFTMLMGELATAVRYELPIKVFVFSNRAFGQIKWEQIVMEGNPEYGVDLQPIDFAKFAECCPKSPFRPTKSAYLNLGVGAFCASS